VIIKTKAEISTFNEKLNKKRYIHVIATQTSKQNRKSLALSMQNNLVDYQYDNNS